MEPITEHKTESILKCHYDQILDIQCFTFSTLRSFPDVLLNFNVLRTLQRTFFETLFPRI